MGIFDAAQDKAAEFADQNPDKVEQFSDQGIERVGDMVDERSGGQFSDKVDMIQEHADQRVGE